MKKALSFFSISLMFAFAFAVVVATASAEGGKVRGEEGTGSVIQNCVHPDGSAMCPFKG